MRHNTFTTTLTAAALLVGGAAYAAPNAATADDNRAQQCSAAPCQTPDKLDRLLALQYENRALRKSLDKVRAQQARYVKALTTPCRLEDSRTCYWEAHERGNGKGTTFVSVGQRYFYLGGAR